jgi:hypothetical protein
MPLGLPSFTAANIIGNLLFSSIGYVVYKYGRSMDKTRLAVQGGVLMTYSYVISETFWMYSIGTCLTAWVWFTRND